jgi:hypothetical protein
MKKLLLFCLISVAANAQSLSPSVNRDSLFKTLLPRFTPKTQEAYTREYNGTAGAKEKDLLLYIMHTQGSKAAMEANLTKNEPHFNRLIHFFVPLVPQEHSVSVTFNPKDALFDIPESIDILIYGPLEGTDLELRNLEPGSFDLDKALARLDWTQQDLDNLKEALQKAGCRGIQNGVAGCDITFSANPLGRFSYIVFNREVGPSAVKAYVTDCTAVQYNERVVLQYTGLNGTECFPE